MHPILFQCKFFTIHTYGFCIAIGILVGIFFIQKEAIRLKKNADKILDYVFYGIVLSFIGTRVFYVIIYFDNFSNNLLDIFKIWKGGLVFYGAPIVAIIYSFFYLKKNKMPFWETVDIVVIGAPIGQFFGRIGCNFAGCCYGKICSLPWAITFNSSHSIAPTGISLHPTQLYSAFYNLLIFLALMFLRKQKKFNGQIICFYMIFYSIARFSVEFFRGDDRGYFLVQSVSTSQAISIIIFILAIFCYAFLAKKETKKCAE